MPRARSTNLTLAIDPALAEQARKVARSMGKSLNELIRDYLAQVTSTADAGAAAEEFRRLSEASKGRSRGWKFNRDEIHERS